MTRTRVPAMIRAIALLLFATAVPATAAQPEPPPPAGPRRVGVLGYAVDPALIEVFKTQLRELGWVEGVSVEFEYRISESKVDALPGRVADLVRSRVDVIVASGTPSVHAAKDGTKTIPVVMVGIGSDPTKDRLVESLARPGGNVTGVAALGRELWGKRLQLFREVVPRLSRLVFLYNRSNSSNVLSEREFVAVAGEAGLTVTSFSATEPAELERVFAQIAADPPEALACAWDALLQAHARDIAQFAIGHKLPMLSAVKEYVRAGALMSYGAKLPEQWRRVAHYVDRILKGANPAELPVEQPMAFELVVNRKTATALGLKIPDVTLLQAEQVIE